MMSALFSWNLHAAGRSLVCKDEIKCSFTLIPGERRRRKGCIRSLFICCEDGFQKNNEFYLESNTCQFFEVDGCHFAGLVPSSKALLVATYTEYPAPSISLQHQESFPHGMYGMLCKSSFGAASSLLLHTRNQISVEHGAAASRK
jgi:hypothetical protein